MTTIERLRALEKKWRGEAEQCREIADELPFRSTGAEQLGQQAGQLSLCADELATLIAELGQEVGAVAYMEPVTCNAFSPADFAEALRKWPDDYDDWFPVYRSSPAHTSEARDADVSDALMAVNDAANRERHAGNYTQANELVRARVTLWKAAEGRDANADANRLDWLASQFRTCTVRMNGQNPHSPNHKAREILAGPTFRDAIDAAMRQEGE